jgi:hypothetical protein
MPAVRGTILAVPVGRLVEPDQRARHAADMVSFIPHLTTNCRVRHVRVSAPLIAALTGNQRYYLPDDLAPACGEELRPNGPTQDHPAKTATRAASLVKTALRCHSAEELGEKLRKRYQRQQQRRGIEPGPDRAAEAALDRLLAECKTRMGCSGRTTLLGILIAWQTTPPKRSYSARAASFVNSERSLRPRAGHYRLAGRPETRDAQLSRPEPGRLRFACRDLRSDQGARSGTCRARLRSHLDQVGKLYWKVRRAGK